jgi:cytochrome b subunit of formate dehydrogenase
MAAEYAGYRLSGAVFWALPALAVLSCAVHAVRRAFGRQTSDHGDVVATASDPGEVPRAGGDGEPPAKKVVLRHSAPQRIYHWANAGATFVLLLTGLVGYSADLLPGWGSAIRFPVHAWFGVILMVGIPFHVVHDAFMENAFGFMWFGRDVFRTQKDIARNFLGLSLRYPKHDKYHPMQISFHWVMAGTLTALIVTGLILWKPTRILFPLGLLGLGWDFVFYCRTLHDFFTSSLIALIIGHVYFAVALKQNRVISKTMLTGTIDYDEYVKIANIRGEVELDRGVGG